MFAPELGVKPKATDLKKTDLRAKEVSYLINPFELKLLAGYLTGQLTMSRLNFAPKNEVWVYLCSTPMKQTHKVVAGYFRIKKMSTLQAYESALANFSTLNQPEKRFYGVTNKQYLELKKKDEAAVDLTQPSFYCDIRKEDPRLFAIHDCLNPVEVYFELKNNVDERAIFYD